LIYALLGPEEIPSLIIIFNLLKKWGKLDFFAFAPGPKIFLNNHSVFA